MAHHPSAAAAAPAGLPRGVVAVEPTDDLSDIAPTENVLELHLAEADLAAAGLPPDCNTFFTYDFYMHDTQARRGSASGRSHVCTHRLVLRFSDVPKMAFCARYGSYQFRVLPFGRTSWTAR